MNIIEVCGPRIRDIGTFVLELDPSIRAEAFRFLLDREFGTEIAPRQQEVITSSPITPTREVAPQELLRKLDAKTMVDVAPVLAYWLEVHQGEKCFSSGRLKEAFEQARETPPVNPSDLVAKLEIAGKLMKAERSSGVQQYCLTRSAIDEIESRIGANRPASTMLNSPAAAIGNQEAISERASQWMRQFDITREELENVFSIRPDGVEFIAASLPGESKRQQTVQAYLMCGLQSYIRNGEFTFNDADARMLCERLACYSQKHHSEYTQAFGNLLAGSKESGWKLTNPGLTEAAKVVKGLVRVV